MFKKLRNKFLILNLVTISIMMMIAFVSIYLMTYNNVHNDINRELYRILDMSPKMMDGLQKLSPHPNDAPPLPVSDTDSAPRRSVSFSLIIDSSGNILDTTSIFDMDEDFYRTAKNTALSKQSTTGTFKSEDTHWTFMIRPYSEHYKIVFLDISAQQGILTNLIYTFLIVALVMLIFIFVISKIFANKAIQPIQDAFDKQKQFIADASHELKTPLAVINTNVDVLLSNGDSTIGSESKWLYYIKNEAERMSKLTNDLLYLAQVDYSEAQMVFSDFNLSEAVLHIILTMEAVIFEHHISLDYTIDPDIILFGSSEQIKQVIMILLDNAAKYTGKHGSIAIALKKRHSAVTLSVTNSGEGIPAEDLSKIFNRFYRVDKARSRAAGGYGLGLSIAKAIVNQHGGEISVTSILNKNTTFALELPLSKL